MKIYWKVAIGTAIIFCLGLALYFKAGIPFSEEKALKMIYGNYDPISKSSTWINIPFPDKEDASGFFEERKGLVRAIFLNLIVKIGRIKFFF